MSDTENPDGQEPEATPDETPEAPAAETPGTPAAETPAEPEVPSTPSEPEAPVTPPTDPPEPAEPATPAEPSEPATPAVPSEPATPTSPAEPEAPIAPPTAAAEPETPAAPPTAEAPTPAAEPGTGTGNTPISAEDDATAPAHDVPAVDGAEQDSGAPVAGAPTPAPDATAAADAAAEDAAAEDVTPRQRPEIPGADLVPDLVPEGEEYLDAEARAAAEADAEAAAALAQDEDSDHHAQPIADAAIDLASGARYVATGKRKTAVARVILRPGTGGYVINGKPIEEFFPRATLQRIIRQPLEAVGFESRMDVVARMHGGGVAAQAGALRHGISRALLEADPNLRGELKRRGFLTRDPRVKERKKAGLKKARKRPQFSKR